MLEALRRAYGLRLLANWGLETTSRIGAGLSITVGLVWIVATTQPWSGPFGSWIRDAPNYYAAGERLNAGHQLYRYMTGDRLLPSDPFAFAGPFIYPPFLGVLWRPVALLPYEVAIVSFWALGLVTLVATLGWLLWRGGTAVSLGQIALVVPLVWTAWAGNMSSMLIPMVIWAWIGMRRGDSVLAGAAIGLAAALKPTPALLVVWLLVERRWRALSAALAVLAVGVLVGAWGAGIGSYVEYVRVARAVSGMVGTIGSLTGVLSRLGVPTSVLTLAGPAVLGFGAVSMLLLHRRPGVAWAIALVAGVVASPAFNLTNVSLLIAAVLPFDRRFGGSYRRVAYPDSTQDRAEGPPQDA